VRNRGRESPRGPTQPGPATAFGRLLVARRREILLSAGCLLAAAAPFKTAGDGLILAGLQAGLLALVALDLYLLLGIDLFLASGWIPINRPKKVPVRGIPPARLYFLGGLTLILAVHLTVRLTGGLLSPLWPAYFLVITTVSFGPRKIRVTGGLLATVALLEGAALVVTGAGPPESGGPTMEEAIRLVGYLACLVLSAVVAAWLSHRRHLRITAVTAERERLEEGARSLPQLDSVVSVRRPGGFSSETGARPDQPGGDEDGTARVPGILSPEFDHSHRVRAGIETGERLQAIVDLAARALGADLAGVFVRDDSGRRLTARAWHAATPGVETGGALPADDSFVEGVLREGSLLVIGNLDPRSPRFGWLTGGSGPRSLAMAPMLVQGVPVGILAAAAAVPDAFRDRRELVMGFADQAAGIYLASHLDVRKDEDWRWHAAFGSLAKTLAEESTEESRILQILLDETAKNMEFRTGAYFAVDEDGDGTLELKMARGLEAAPGSRFPSDKCLLGHVVENRQPLLIVDLNASDRKIPVVTGLNLDCRSLMAVPVFLGSRLKGIFLAGDPRPERFRHTHFDILNTLTRQIGVLLDNAAMKAKLEKMASTDGLTGLSNHRHFHERLEAELVRVGREAKPFSVIILDIDHFKKVNDSYGHPFGDIVLKGVAALLRSLAREVDVVARYGGEEMALVLVNTGREGAAAMARRIMKELHARTWASGGESVAVTASLGSSTWPDDGRTSVDLIRTADEALYHSKKTGRDRYTPAGSLESIPA
jgi:diguanylate cyclase (GGDEF)-like protein